MQQDQGVPPSGSSHSAEPEPSCTVSAVPASVPNAGLLPGDIVQITNPDHHWFPALIVVSELKAIGIQGFAFMPTNDGSGTGEAYIRLSFGDYESLGAAAIVLSESTAAAREAAQ